MQNVTSINSKQMSNALCHSDFKTYLNTILSPQDRRAGIILLASTNENGIIALLREHFCFVHYIAGNRAIANITWTDEQICKNLDYIRWDEKAKEWDGIIANKVSSEPTKFAQCGKKVDPDLAFDFGEGILKLATKKKPDKLNLCELLKNQIGIELYCTAYGTVTVYTVKPDSLLVKVGNTIGSYIIAEFNSNGSLFSFSNTECILFPSKDQRDWSKFNPCQFKDGELVWVRNHRLELWKCLYHTGKQADDGSHICYPAQTKELGNPIETFINCVKFDKRPF